MTAITNVSEILEIFASRKTNIEARNVPVGNYVLAWSNGLMVRVDPETKQGSATGFEHATFFGDRAAAMAYARRTNIRNGKNEHPTAVLAFNAKQGALLELDRVMKDVEKLG